MGRFFNFIHSELGSFYFHTMQILLSREFLKQCRWQEAKCSCAHAIRGERFTGCFT